MQNKESEKEENYSNLLSEIEDEKLYGNVKPISFKNLRIINEQNKYSVCKIIKGKKIYGTGFLCFIPFKTILNRLPVLLTCNHVLSKEDVEIGKEIKLIFDDKNIKILVIDESRKVYKENPYDITMIEIKESDGFNMTKLLEIDYEIYDEGQLNDKFKNEPIYLIHYPKGSNSSFSNGVIKKIDSNNLILGHNCSTEYGSSGAPIINSDTFKVIGLHKGNNKNNKFNCGIILRKPIEDFYDKINGLSKDEPPKVNNPPKDSKDEHKKINIDGDSHENEINLKLKVFSKDINKKVYFLDNTNYISWSTKIKHYHDYLKELNESNTKVYINNKEIKYSKYFTPKEKGIYDIKIVFNVKMKDISFIFSNCSNILSIDFSSFDASYATNMRSMFYQCKLLKSINFTSFDTSNATDMSFMFYNCTNLDNLDISSFDIKKVENTKDMFLDCNNLKTIKVNTQSYDKIKPNLKLLSINIQTI